ncbi:MAG: lipopolysaccharide assembly protein LapA domain-containing protein [Bacillota bacterium]|nr:lipopolysaccharide assembly protein LapA domain-containing protein [Bacillota bacterium]
MRILFIILMIIVVLAVVIVAVLNNDMVTVNYIFGEVELTLFMVILGSALAGILVMIFYGIYRSIHNYIKSESERNYKKELQRRVKFLENENKKLEEELENFKKEREKTAERAKAKLEAEKNELAEELNKQRREREETTAKEQAELEAEKQKLEEKLRKQQNGNDVLEVEEDSPEPQKKGFWDFLKR